MALAILKYQGTQGNYFKFYADIGTNQFFNYWIGRRTKKYKGIEFVDQITFKSPIQALGGAGKAPQSSFVLKVPKDRFRNNVRRIQLFSFKDNQGNGIAASEVLLVNPTSVRESKDDFLSSILSTELETIYMEHIPVKYKALSYTEPGISRGMFWSSIVSALPGLIKTAAPLIGNLLNKGGGGNNQAGGNNEILNSIIELLGNLKNQNGAGGNMAASQSVVERMAISPAILMNLAPLLQKIISPETLQAVADQPVKLLKTIGDALVKMNPQDIADLQKHTNNQIKSTKSSYSEAKVAPAVLAALPALAPLIEKALDPKTIDALTGQPRKLLKAVTDAVMQWDKQEMEHLERLNPGFTDDRDNMLLLASMSVSPSQKIAIPFQFKSKIEIEFLQVKHIQLMGKSRLVYSNQADLHFPIRVFTNAENAPDRPIPKVIIQAIITDAVTNDVLHEKKYKLKDVLLGSTIEKVVFPHEVTRKLPPNKELKLEISFIWRGKNSKRNCGTFKVHHFTIVNEYLFDRIGAQTGENIPLNDVVNHRPFWHKVWEGGFSKSRRWEINFDVKYYYALDLEETAIVKLEAKHKIKTDNAKDQAEEPNRREITSMLKSGLEVSLDALNKLLPNLGQTPLNENQLRALNSTKLQQYYNQVARVNLEIKGRSGDTGTLWTYPEIALHQIHLVKPAAVNQLGMVTSLSEETIQFPRPAAIHFIGTKSL